jgi:hypothetical protein
LSRNEDETSKPASQSRHNPSSRTFSAHVEVVLRVVSLFSFFLSFSLFDFEGKSEGFFLFFESAKRIEGRKKADYIGEGGRMTSPPPQKPPRFGEIRPDRPEQYFEPPQNSHYQSEQTQNSPSSRFASQASIGLGDRAPLLHPVGNGGVRFGFPDPHSPFLVLLDPFLFPLLFPSFLWRFPWRLWEKHD